MSGNLVKYGFRKPADDELNEGEYYARITSQSKGIYTAVTDDTEVLCEITGKMRYDAQGMADYPAVGDFVVLDRDDNQGGNAIIRRILPRKSKFVRNASGSLNEEQIVATNIDYAFICTSLNNDFNLKRIERYITLAFNSGAMPVVVLTKADLCDDVMSKLSAVESVAPGVEILLTSSFDEDGLEEIEPYLKEGRTIALLGSSGVGKSTMINHLIGEDFADVSGIRDDDKGRHTTTRRQMYLIKNGTILIDTPGMRELGLVSDTDDFSQSFEDVESFFGLCKFRDCTHTNEPGCAIYKAIANGELSEKRWNSYNRLKNENEYAQDKAAYLEKKTQALNDRRKLKQARAKEKKYR